MVTLEVLDERRAPRALLLEPLELVRPVVRVVVNPIRVLIERRDVPNARTGKASDRDAADSVGTLWILVLPSHIVAGASRDDVDFVLSGQALGQKSAQMLRAAKHLAPIALNDKRKLHGLVMWLMPSSPEWDWPADRSRQESARATLADREGCARRRSPAGGGVGPR